jgi:hypothetical protein
MTLNPIFGWLGTSPSALSRVGASRSRQWSRTPFTLGERQLLPRAEPTGQDGGTRVGVDLLVPGGVTGPSQGPASVAESRNQGGNAAPSCDRRDF